MNPTEDNDNVEQASPECPPGIVMGEVRLILDIKRKYSSVADPID